MPQDPSKRVVFGYTLVALFAVIAFTASLGGDHASGLLTFVFTIMSIGGGISIVLLVFCYGYYGWTPKQAFIRVINNHYE